MKIISSFILKIIDNIVCLFIIFSVLLICLIMFCFFGIFILTIKDSNERKNTKYLEMENTVVNLNNYQNKIHYKVEKTEDCFGKIYYEIKKEEIKSEK